VYTTFALWSPSHMLPHLFLPPIGANLPAP
jgi:hypothetical protein